MTPEIAVVVPTHNRVRLLAATLRSVLSQRDVALEAIVVDDGSCEDVAGLIGTLRDPRVRAVRHDSPLGVSIARNRGALEARAAWLAFCDDDDLWAPDKLACQLAAARAARRTWAYGGAVHVNAATRLMSVAPLPSPDRLVATLPRWNLVPGGSSNVIVQADVFRRAGGWDPTLINLADWELWARLAREGPPACVDAPLVAYRIHHANASADTGLILREARVLDRRYGGTLDYGELHHYLAWVYLRCGRRRPAVRHLASAAARGHIRDVARTIVSLAPQRAAKQVPALGRRPSEQSPWAAQAESWLAPLRGGT